MIITRWGKGIVLTCDCCGHEVKYFDEFQEAVDYKKENGWKSERDQDGWKDICPDCRQ